MENQTLSPPLPILRNYQMSPDRHWKQFLARNAKVNGSKSCRTWPVRVVPGSEDVPGTGSANIPCVWGGRGDLKEFMGTQQIADLTLSTQNLQDVADDPDAPHVRGVADELIVDDFWGHKFRGPKQYFEVWGALCNRK